MGQKPALGKGLASLFPSAATQQNMSTAPTPTQPLASGASAAGPALPAASEVAGRDRHPGISIAAIDEIIANKYQPRRDFDDQALEELAQSIRSNGIIQPLVVRRCAEGWELIAGERRLRAAKLAGLKHVPIVIRKSTDKESLELALIENIQRQDLNCIDEALAYFQLLEEFSLTQEEIAKRVGKDRATVANYLRLLRLPEPIIEDLKKQTLSFGHGKALLSTDDNELRMQVRAMVLEKRLSVRDTEALVEELKKLAESSPKQGVSDQMDQITPIQTRMANLAQDLTRQWSTKVEIRGSERRGKIIFHYSSRSDLDRILSAMQNDKIWAEQST